MKLDRITHRTSTFSGSTLIAVALLLLIGCSEPAWHSWYLNDDFGLSVPLPIGWEIIDDETMLRNEHNAAKVFLDDDSHPEEELREAFDGTHYVAILAPPGFNPDVFVPPAVYVIAESVEDGETVWGYQEKYSRYNSELGFSQTRETQTEPFSGGKVLISEFVNDSLALPIHEFSVVYRSGNTFVSVEALGTTPEHRSLLERIIGDISIE